MEPDWKHIHMHDIFTKEQLDYIWKVCKRTTLEESITELKPWFLKLKEQLEPKGLLAEYAVYAIPYHIHQALAEEGHAGRGH